MIKITIDKKPLLNKLISYYRCEYSKHDERFLMKNFIYDKEGFRICTIPTLSRIESNKANSYENIYYSLLDNLGISYIEDSKADKLIHAINLSLLKFAEINDAKNIIDKINKAILILKPYLNYALYKEQAEVYQILLDYYQDYKFNPEMIDKYNVLFDLIDEPLKLIYIEIAYNYYIRIHLDAKKSLETLKLITYCKYDSIMFDYTILLLYYREYNLYKEKELGYKLIKKCIEVNNKFYLCKTYNVLASLYTQQNPELAIEYLQKAIDNFDSKFDTKYNLSIYTRNLGILSSVNNHHSNAVKYFKALETLNYDDLLITFPYYICSLGKMNTNNKEVIKLLKYLNSYSHLIEKTTFIHLLHLYQIKYNVDAKYSIEEVIYEFMKLGKALKSFIPILNIIEDELYEVCKSKKSFQLYKSFMKNLH